MADTSDLIFTLDDLLTNLADGLARAQAELSRAGAQGPPGLRHSYHIPSLNFELKLNLHVVDSQELSERYRSVRPEAASNRHLMFQAPQPNISSSSTLDIAATIRGAFVAVPANEGLPATFLETQIATAKDGKVKVSLWVRNAAGESLAGVPVEFNLDREQSGEFSEGPDGEPSEIGAGTGFKQGVVRTDATGLALGELVIQGTAKGTRLAIVIDAVGRTETLVYEVP